MVKFKIKNKGTITQGVAENLNPLYASQGIDGHTGVDWTKGWGSFVFSDNQGYVYKTYEPQEREDNWTAVYMLVPYHQDFMEICIGHLSSVWVKEGQSVLEGQCIGKEGNFGTVYTGGLRITPQMQDAGDRRGSHAHESYRPVRRVTDTISGVHYLRDKDGRKFKKDGYYYEIIETNGIRGHVDPMDFVYNDSVLDQLRCIGNALFAISL